MQKLNIVLRSELLTKGIEDEAKESQVGSFKGNQHKKVVSASEDANSKKGKNKHENSGDGWNYISTLLNLDSKPISD